MTATLTAAEEAELRTSVHGIVAKFGNEYFTQCSETLQPPTELWDALASGGFVGVNLPEEYGGGGMGLTAMSIVAEEAAAAGCPEIMLMISPGIVGSLLARHATPEQKRRWLAPMAAGKSKIAFAITEPDAGSNSHNISTIARRDGGDWMLSGQKTFITAIDQADAVLVVARTDRQKLSLFLVETDTPGIEMQRIPMTFEITDKSFTVFLDNVAVDADRVIGGEGNGLRVAFDGMNPERVIIASICNGIARYAIDKAVAYARERKVWTVPIGAHQGVAHPLAEAKIALEAARLMTRHAAAGYDAGIDAGEVASGRRSDPLRRPSHRGTRRQRLHPRSRAGQHVRVRAAVQDRADHARNGSQLHRTAQPRPAEVILTAANSLSEPPPARWAPDRAGMAGTRRAAARHRPPLGISTG
jgi:alkylation response protein AidB-like acyl-CoA dehydrogenase